MPNSKFETNLQINLAEIPPAEENLYESLPERSPEVSSISPLLVGWDFDGNNDPNTENDLDENLDPSVLEPLETPAELEEQEPLSIPESEPLNSSELEPEVEEEVASSSSSSTISDISRLFVRSRSQPQDDNEDNNFDINDAAEAIEEELNTDSDSDSVLSELSSSRFDSEYEKEQELTNKASLESNFLDEQKALFNSLPELSDLSDQVKSLLSDDSYLENKYSINLIKGIELENLNDPAAPAQAIEGNLDENVEESNRPLDSSSDSEESVIVTSSKKRSKKALSGQKSKKARGEGLSVKEQIHDMLSTKLIKRKLKENSSYYDQIIAYYKSARYSFRKEIRDKQETEEQKIILEEKLDKAHKDCLDKLELNKERVNREKLFAKRFMEYPYETI
jgi:hypothetical protein